MAPPRGEVMVAALSSGSLSLPERFFIKPNDPYARRTVPSLSFLVQHTHATTKKLTRVLFDLGLRRDISTYSTPIQRHCASRQPMKTTPDVKESLAAGDLTPDDIDYVILSHVHYDHIGTPADFQNPQTKFVVGPGALDLLDGKTNLQLGSHSFFEKDLLPLERTIELPASAHHPANGLLTPQASNDHAFSNQTPDTEWRWKPLSIFPNTIDLFNDGSLYIINAPGHLPGHINLLARLAPTSPLAEPRSVYLAGDACHDIRLFTGEREIATWTDDEGKSCCIHADRHAAQETIGRIREFQESGRKDGSEDNPSEEDFGDVEVVFAHNWAWEEDARERGRFWPGHL